MKNDSKILVTGASGMVGSNLVRLLRERGFINILMPDRTELGLENQQSVNDYFHDNRPEYVFHLAARVGGIHANSAYPAEFIYQNTVMHANVFEASRLCGVRKICFPGSACTYPKFAHQPVAETELMASKIEETNIAYAVAKINGIVMAQSYAKQYNMNCIVPMPTNVYGINDNFNDNASHVIPALIKKIHLAKINGASSVDIWGDGTPLREFLFSTDCADGLLFLMQNYNSSDIINLSTMDEISILELAKKIINVIGYNGNINLLADKPNGAPRKCLDNSKIRALGWKPAVSLDEGLALTYRYYLESVKKD